MDAQTDTPSPLPRTLLFVDHPNLLAMEKFFDRSIKPSRLKLLAEKRGDVVYSRVFTDHQRMVDWRQSRDWVHAGFDIQYCPRYGRPETERINQSQSLTKESVDPELIADAYKFIEQMRPDQFILVAGDSDYVRLVRTVAQEMKVATRVFLTAPCRGLMELPEKVLTETYTLFDKENPAEVSAAPLLQRISSQRRDIYLLSARDKAELNQISEMLVKCDCHEEVAIGLWKAHDCHPKQAAATHATKRELTAPPALAPCLPARPAGGSAGRSVVTVPQPQTDESAGPVTTAEEPVPAAPGSSLLSSILHLDAERWERIRAAARSIPKEDTMSIKAALKNASPEISLAWLIDAKRVSPSQDEIFALKGLIEKRVDCPVVAWQQTLLCIRDEFTEILTLPDTVHRLKIWTKRVLFGDALALLIDGGVIEMTGQNLFKRGSLMHPAFRFAGDDRLMEALSAIAS